MSTRGAQFINSGSGRGKVRRKSPDVPFWAAVLAALVLASWLLRWWLSRGMLGPFIMPDELIYAELAKSFAGDGAFSIRDAQHSNYPMLYPLAISPAYAAFDSLTDAYAAVKAINALLASLAAVPAYMLARRVVPPHLAIVAAALTLALPALAYTGTVMSENLFFGVGLVIALGLVRVLERPTWGRSVLLLLVLAVGFETRAQALVLLPASLSAPVLLIVLARERLGRVASFWRLYASFAGAAFLVLAVQIARGQSLTAVLGAYGVVAEENYDVGRVLRFWAWHLEEMVIAVGVVPAVALIAQLVRSRTLERHLQEHLAVTTSCLISVTLGVAVFASRFAVPERILERSMFFLAPLLFIALVAWAARPEMIPRSTAFIGGTICVALVALFPYRRFISEPARADTFALIPIWNNLDTLLAGSVTITVSLLAALLASIVVVLPRRWFYAAPAILLCLLVVASASVWYGAHGVRTSGAHALFQGIQGVPRDWIDRAVPRGTRVTVLYAGGDRFTINQNEFFNRSVGEVLFTRAPELGGDVLGSSRVLYDETSGAVKRTNGDTLSPGYLLTDGTVSPDGKLLVRDAGTSMGLWSLVGPLRLTKTSIAGWYEDLWSGPELRWTRENCRRGTLSVTLSGDAQLFPKGQVVITDTGKKIRVPPPPNGPVILRVPVQPRGRTCSVRFSISPTAIPSKLFASSDDRELGTHFRTFTYERQSRDP